MSWCASAPATRRTTTSTSPRPASANRAVVRSSSTRTAPGRTSSSPTSAVLAAQRDVGGLDGHRQVRAAPQVVQQHLAPWPWRPRPRGPTPGRARRSRGRAAAPARLPANRSPPTWDTSQTAAACGPAASARATGRPSSAQQASWRPWVHTARTGASSRRRARATRPAPSAARSRSSARRRSGRGRRPPATSAAPAARAATTRVGPSPARLPGSPDEQHPHPVAGATARCRCAPSPSGSRASRRASVPHGPGCSTSRKLRTVEAVPASSSAAARLGRRSTGSAVSGRPRAGPPGPAVGTAPARSARRAARSAGVSIVAGGDLLERGPDPRRHPEDAVADAAPCSRVAVVDDDAGVARRGGAGGCRAPIRSTSASRSSRAPASRGGRLLRKRSTWRAASAAGSRRRTASATAARWSREALGQRGGVVEVAGGHVVVGHLGEQASDLARHQAAPRELVDADRHVQRDRPAPGRRAACRWGGRPRTPGSSSSRPGRSRSPCTSHMLGAVGLEDEHVVGVGVHREALRAGRGEVGVGLAGVAELELQLGDQVAHGRPVALQALQHDGRALVVQAHQP